MDILSAAASVIAVVQIAQSVGTALKDYYEGVRDAREDIRKLYNSVKSLEVILLSFQKVHQRQDGQLLLNANVLAEAGGPLKQAQGELEKLVAELKFTPNEKKVQKALQSLKWPFKKKDIEKVVASIERHKLSFNVALGIETLSISSEQFDISVDIRSEIRAAREDDKRRQIVEWLSKEIPDPSKEHNLARSRHEDTTGSWLIESDELANWFTDPNSFMWIYGGAGAGKSILCSTVINHLQVLCKNEPNSAVVYWYLTFTDQEKQKVSSLLSSLISDLCSNRRDTPEGLQNAYDQANYGQQRPDLKTLTSMLRDVMLGFENIYIFVDALDECPKDNGERSSLLELLRHIYDWEIDGLHLLVTSRKELDIEESFRDFAATIHNFSTISVQGRQVEADIKQYIGHRLQGPEFRKWKPKLKIDVETALASRADGMFRLVALQLDSLGQLRAESKIRSALAELPRTLHEFYDHIIDNIKPDDKEYCFRALQWLAHAARPMLLSEIAEAVIVEPSEAPYFNEEDRFMNDEDLLEILTAGLVTAVHYNADSDSESGSDWELSLSSIEPSEAGSVEVELDARSTTESQETMSQTSSRSGIPVIQFAHFSVKEYLTRDGAQLRSKHHIDKTSSEQLITRSCFAYVIFVGSQMPAIEKSINAQFPLLSYAGKAWPYHMKNLGTDVSNENLMELALTFLEDGSYPWRIWEFIAIRPQNKLEQNWASDLRRLANGFDIRFPTPSMSPVTWVSAAGLEVVLDHMLRSQGKQLRTVADCEGSSPLYAAIRNDQVDIVRVLIEAGYDVNENFGRYGNIQGSSLSGSIEIVNILLKSGADINTQYGKYGYPLQAAALKGNTEVVKILLANGADINADGGYWGSALAAAAANGDTSLTDLLLRNGANVNQQGGKYGNPLQAACFSAGLQGRDFINMEDVVAILLQAGAHVNARGGKFETALQAAVTAGDFKTSRLLLQNGADVNIKGGFWGTALIAAARSWPEQKGELFVRLLLSKGADPDFQVEAGVLGVVSVLQYASYFEKHRVARRLLNHGANINAFTEPSGSALRIAVTNGDLDTAFMLLDEAGEMLNVEEWRIVMSLARVKYGTTRWTLQQDLMQELENYVEKHGIFKNDADIGESVPDGDEESSKVAESE